MLTREWKPILLLQCNPCRFTCSLQCVFNFQSVSHCVTVGRYPIPGHTGFDVHFIGLSSHGSVFQFLVIWFSLLWHLSLVNVKIQQIGVTIPLSSVCVGVGETGSFRPTVTGNFGPCISAITICYSPGIGPPFCFSLVSVTEAGSGTEANHLPSVWLWISAAQLSTMATCSWCYSKCV